MFQKPLFAFTGNEASNLVNFINWDILNHWVLQA